jgi:glycosyltransferase involved in cell wall biosynthesis
LETIAEWPGLERRTQKPSRIRDDLKPSESPMLTLYIPTFQRDELRALLESIADQWCERVEVVVSDNDPAGSAEAVVSEVLGSVAEYSRRLTNIGGDANILRGIMAGRGEYVWIIGDDDVLLPGALADTLAIIDAEHPDRIIHWDENALQLVPAGHSGTMRSLIEELGDDTSLLIASTLITANVYKRAVLDPTLGHAMIETCYGHVYAGIAAESVKVNDWPRLVVGCDHPGYIDGFEEIYARLLEAITDKADVPGIPLENALRWNYVSLALA